jgi:hypothetical protein
MPRDSGRITGNLRRPKRYNRRLRCVFYMTALSSNRAEGPSRRFYDRKRAERLIHTQALPALARRLVDSHGHGQRPHDRALTAAMASEIAETICRF